MLYMTNEEIWKRYLNAENISEYPLICSELNGCNLSVIYDILESERKKNGIEKPIKPHERDCILIDYQMGYSDNELMYKYDKTDRQIISFRSRYDLEENPKQGVLTRNREKVINMYEKGACDKEIASFFNLGLKHVKEWKADYGIPNYNHFTLIRRRKMVDNGYTVKQIAAAEKIKTSSIYKYLEKNNLLEVYREKQRRFKQTRKN